MDMRRAGVGGIFLGDLHGGGLCGLWFMAEERTIACFIVDGGSIVT